MKRAFINFAILHDYIKLFVILYVALSAILAIFFGLFYFFLWIFFFHYFLEIVKRYYLFEKITFTDFLVSLQHCRIDLTFLCVGIAFEALAHYSIALAPGRLRALWMIEKELSLTSREIRILELFRILPKVLGTAKAAKSTAHIVNELLTHTLHKERKYFKLEKADLLCAGISLFSIFFTFSFLLHQGLSVPEIILHFFKTLKP